MVADGFNDVIGCGFILKMIADFFDPVFADDYRVRAAYGEEGVLPDVVNSAG